MYEVSDAEEDEADVKQLQLVGKSNEDSVHDDVVSEERGGSICKRIQHFCINLLRHRFKRTKYESLYEREQTNALRPMGRIMIIDRSPSKIRRYH